MTVHHIWIVALATLSTTGELVGIYTVWKSVSKISGALKAIDSIFHKSEELANEHQALNQLRADDPLFLGMPYQADRSQTNLQFSTVADGLNPGNLTRAGLIAFAFGAIFGLLTAIVSVF